MDELLASEKQEEKKAKWRDDWNISNVRYQSLTKVETSTNWTVLLAREVQSIASETDSQEMIQ